MSEIRTDSLLLKLFELAKTSGGTDSSLVTAERFIIAVMDASSLPLEGADAATVARAQKMLAAAGISVKEGREKLSNHLKTNGVSFLDDLYMKKKITAAKKTALDRELSSVGVLLLLELILSEPTDAIVQCASEKETDTHDGVAFEVHPTGEDKAPPQTTKEKIAELTRRVKDVHAQLASRVYGQDKALSVFSSGYFRAELLSLTDKERTRPAATYLFAGPPGVGKTYLAECAASVLGLPFMRFDMSEYCDKEAAIEFCGSDSVYKNSKGGNFTEFVSKNPRSVVLFDEIEKAHISIIHLFLQILDAGRIRDSKSDEEISLKDVIMIFTTNAGKELYEQSESGDYSAVTRKVILSALQKDVNPATNAPYFPSAICSRFASGNVVMFNRLTAYDLCNIAKREILRHAENYKKEVGVEFYIDEKVYTAILLSEGGNADGRTIRSRAEAFFDNELFELFRLTGAQHTDGSVEGIERINIVVELPSDKDTVRALFEPCQTPSILVFGSEQTYDECEAACPYYNFVLAQDIDTAQACLRETEVSLVLIDPLFGLDDKRVYLNIEDADSPARDFFRLCRERYSDVCVYFTTERGREFDEEERISLLRLGAKGILTLCAEREGAYEFAKKLELACEQIHRQNSVQTLAKANKIISFESAQRLYEKGKCAEIRLFDIDLAVAMDAEDTKDVVSDVSKPNVSFDSVIGAEDAKEELKYFANYLKDPKKYRGTGVKAPKGVLLWGPPGTGKTMLAKAMAHESDVTFISAQGNQFLKRYAGQGPEAVHELFRKARKYAPSILFIDEIDAIAKERTGEDYSGADEILTAFLVEMDGFKNDAAKPVFVLAATNFDVEPGSSRSLDRALLRRFDRRVYIDLPSRSDRIRYMKMKVEKNKTFDISDEKIDDLALRSTAMSLAELESVFELSLRCAIRSGATTVTDGVLEEAFETFNGGEKKEWSESTLERVARHEAGHAFLYWHSGETPSYVTVVARGGHGGYMQRADNEDKLIYTREEMLSSIRTSLGGRAAEIVYYGERDGVSTGAGGDLASATETARRMLCTYGMYEEFGLSVMDAAASGELFGRVKEAVDKILSEQMSLAIEIIQNNRDKIDALVRELMNKNHLSGAELAAVFGNGR